MRLNVRSKIIVDKGNCNVHTADLKKPGQVTVITWEAPTSDRLTVSPLNNLGRVFGLGARLGNHEGANQKKLPNY